MQTLQDFVSTRAWLSPPSGENVNREHTCIPLVLADVYIDGKPNDADVARFKHLLSQQWPRNGQALDFADGIPKLAVELGGFLGDQELAYKVMGLGEFYGVWRILRPFEDHGDVAEKDRAMSVLAARVGLLGFVGYASPTLDLAGDEEPEDNDGGDTDEEEPDA